MAHINIVMACMHDDHAVMALAGNSANDADDDDDDDNGETRDSTTVRNS